MGCSTSRLGASRPATLNKSGASAYPGSANSIPIIVPVTGIRLRSSCPSTPESGSSLIILPQLAGKDTSPQLSSSARSSARTTPGLLDDEVSSRSKRAGPGGQTLHTVAVALDKAREAAAGSVDVKKDATLPGDGALMQFSHEGTVQGTGTVTDCKSALLSTESTPRPPLGSAIQETVTAALNKAGYFVVHAPSPPPPRSGSTTPSHPAARTMACRQSPEKQYTSINSQMLQAAGTGAGAGARVRVPSPAAKVCRSAPTTPAPSPTASPAPSAASTPKQQVRRPGRTPLPSSSHYRHSHRYGKPLFPNQNGNTVRFANLDHASVLSFRNLESVSSFSGSEPASARQNVLKDVKLQNVTVASLLDTTDAGSWKTGHTNPASKPHSSRNIVVTHGSAVYVTNAAGQKLTAVHQPEEESAPPLAAVVPAAVAPQEEIKQLKPRVPIPVAIPVHGHSQPSPAGGNRIEVTRLSSFEKHPPTQGSLAHNFPPKREFNITVTKNGAAPQQIPVDLAESLSEASSQLSSSDSNVVDNSTAAASFRDIMSTPDPLVATSWSTAPYRKNFLKPNSITDRVLLECQSLEAKLGFFERNVMLNPLEIEDEAMSFDDSQRSNSSNSDQATYKLSD